MENVEDVEVPSAGKCAFVTRLTQRGGSKTITIPYYLIHLSKLESGDLVRVTISRILQKKEIKETQTSQSSADATPSGFESVS